jgi:hypothetical protein
MSLLNRPSSGMHGLLTVIFKLLLREKQMERTRLEALCGPESLVTTNQVSNTLNKWLALGLFAERPGKEIALHSDVRADEKNLGMLPGLARRLVMRPENNAELWANDNVRAADFTRGVTWLLAQDVYAAELAGWKGSTQDLLTHQLPRQPASEEDEKDLQFVTNNERWAPLKAWGTWLGFGWNSVHKPGGWCIDPTAAVREQLPTILGKQKVLEAPDLIAALAETLPVLDGGTYRLAVEGKLRERIGPQAWVAPPNGQLSTSLSRALLRLIDDGTLRTENRADAPRRVNLTGRGQTIIRTISHFTLSRLP